MDERRQWRVHHSDYRIDIQRHRRCDVVGQPQCFLAAVKAQKNSPNCATGSTLCRRNSKEVTMPKVPPPRIAKN